MGKKKQFHQIYKRNSCYKGEESINSRVLWIMPLLLNLLDYEISSLPKKKKRKRKKEWTLSILHNFLLLA